MDKTEDIKSVEDIDALLAKEFKLEESEKEEEVKEPEQEAENTDGDDEGEKPEEKEEEKQETSEEEEKSEDDESDEKPSKKTPEDKKDYAFDKLRKEASANKKKAQELEAEAEFLKNLAKSYGYDDVNAFKKAYEDASIKKEAKEKGYNEELYTDFVKTKAKIQELEKYNAERDLADKTNNFRNALDEVLKEYSFGEDVKSEVFKKFEDEGYNVDFLLNLPNPKSVIKGVLLDRIQEKNKIEMKKVEKAKDIDSITDEGLESAKGVQSISLDKLIADEIKSYKDRNFYK